MKQEIIINFENNSPISVGIKQLGHKDEIIPLFSDEIEQAILRNALQNEKAWEEISNTLTPTSFYFEKHQQLFSCMQDLKANDKCLHIVEVAENLDRSGTLSLAGGLDYLVDLAKHPFECDIQACIQEIAHAALLREHINAIVAVTV
ncbi:MAG: DnaB-like helicase N-terminal domain-containing protein [Neptuniibacter sp.]